MADRFDVATLVQGRDLTIAPSESPEDARHRRIKSMWLFAVGLAFAVIMMGTAFWFLLTALEGSKTQDWAFRSLSTLLGALLGFLVGKAAK